MSERTQRVQTIQYTGTIESYNQMVKAIYYDRDKYQINFINENHEWVNEFTGHLAITEMEVGGCYGGKWMKPGDYYQITDEEKFMLSEAQKDIGCI